MRRLSVAIATLSCLCCTGCSPRHGSSAMSAAGSNTASPDGSSGSSDAADTSPRVVIVTSGPSHGPGEHEYHAGALLMSRFLAELGVSVDVVRNDWPVDPSIFDGARAIGFMSNGNLWHPLANPDRLGVISRALARGAGFFCIHWSVHYPDAFVPEALRLLGASYTNAASVNPMWIARSTAFPGHPVMRGVAPFELYDEWYYNLVFATDRPLTVLLSAVPPESTRFTADAAAHPGRVETMAWTYERADGGRSFGYTGLHFHKNWGTESVRRLVVNAILWTAQLDIPLGGAPVTLDPAWLLENLDPK